MTGERKEI